MYSVSGEFGEVKFFKNASPSNRFQSIDHLLSVGWHKVNELYHISREKGYNVGLLIMTVAGEGNVCINGKSYAVKEGEVAVLPKQIQHSYACAPNKSWEFYWMHYYGENADLSINDIVQGGEYVFDLGFGFIEFLMNELVKGKREGIERELEESELLRRILYALLNKTVSTAKPDNWIVEEIRETLEQQEKTDFSLQELVDKYHYTKEHIIRVFTFAMGMSPYHYWLISKLKKSCTDLKENFLSVSEIANKYGYKSVSSYSKQFKKIYKVSPNEYRSLHVLR